MDSPIILALDTPRMPDWILDVSPYVAGFKVGLRLFCAQGPSVMDRLPVNVPVFLDLKFHDIPNTIVEAITELRYYPNIRWITVHTQAGEEALGRARKAAAGFFCRAEIVAVPRLTSDVAIRDLRKFEWDVQDELHMASTKGIYHAVLPPSCLPFFRGELNRKYWDHFTFFCPGIRLGVEKDDHASVVTTAQAIRDGADYLIIGRPILQAADPVKQCIEVLEGLSS